MPYKNRQQKLEAQKRHYRENKEKYANKQYLRRLEKAKWFFEYKSTLQCACGENHPACIGFHHRNPLEKEGDVSAFVHAGYSKETILKEIAKCDVMCANCHMKKHWQERMDEGTAKISPVYKFAALV